MILIKGKDDVEMAKARAAAAVRSAIRLKHSLRAADEINDKLPEIISAIEVAAVKGEPYELRIGSLFED